MAGETLIVFQVSPTGRNQTPSTTSSGQAGKLTKLSASFRVLLEAVYDNALRSVKSARGVEIPFDLK